MLAWFPVDDEMSFHPKIMAAGNAAIGAWTRAGAWCKKYTTGGFVPEGIAHSFGLEESRRLVEVGLWSVDTDPEFGAGYRFHEWTDRAGNGTAGEERARKEKERERWRKQKQAQRARGNQGGQEECPPADISADPPPVPACPQSQSQSNDLLLTESVSLGSNRAREDETDSEAQAAAERLASAMGLDLEKIRTAARGIDRDLDHGRALRLATIIIAKARREPKNATAYVMGAFRQSPLEVQQVIDTEVMV